MLHAQGAKVLVVETFRGAQGGSLRNAAVANLQTESGYEVAESGAFEKAAGELGLKPAGLRAESYLEIAKQMGASAFIEGRVEHRRRQWILTLRVRDGATGAILGSAQWSGSTVAALQGVRKNASERLLPILQKAKKGAAPAPVLAKKPAETGASPFPAPRKTTTSPFVAPQPSPAAPPRAQPSTPAPRPQASGSPWYVKPKPKPPAPAPPKAEAESVAAAEETEGDETFARSESSSSEAPPLEAFSTSLSIGTLHRSIGAQATVLQRFRDPNTDPANNATVQEKRSYESDGLGHAEIGLQAEFYPGALPKSKPLPWLGLMLSYRHSLGLGSSGPACTQPNCPMGEVKIGTSQSELYVGARSRHRFGNRLRSPMVFADLGWGNFRFTLDPDDLAQVDRSTIVPPLSYGYVHAGAGLQYPIVPTYLLAALSGGARIGLDVGNQAQAIWGVESEAKTGFVLALDFRSEAPYLFKGAFFSLNLQFFQFRSRFRGQTACREQNCGGANTNTPDLWEPWPFENNQDNVTGGIRQTVKDTYFRLGFAFGYAYR